MSVRQCVPFVCIAVTTPQILSGHERIRLVVCVDVLDRAKSVNLAGSLRGIYV